MSIVAEQFPTYQPAMRIITAITNAFPALVTTSFDHQYLTGTIVQLRISPADGMQQANKQFGEIAVTSPTQFTIAIDTTSYDPFIVATPPPGRLPPGVPLQYSQCVPIGERNDMLTGAVQNVLPYP